MNKQEYLERLEACLKHKLSREEIEDIMRDYAEYFEEGRRQSKQDSEISAKLGDPELVAQQLIEESQEQKNEYHSSGKSTDKKKPWNYAAQSLHRLKDKFQEWDKGDGRYREESPEPEEQNFRQEERFQSVEESVQEKKKQSDGDPWIVRGCKAIGRGCRWCVYAALAATMLMIAATISMVLVGFAVTVLGGLAAAIAFVASGILMGIAGIIASGFGFAFFSFWSGIAALSGSIALIGFCSLLELLLLKILRVFWGWCKNAFSKAAELWMRMLRKIESWLIVRERTEKKPQQKKGNSSSIPVLPILPEKEEQKNSMIEGEKSDENQDGKEVR